MDNETLLRMLADASQRQTDSDDSDIYVSSVKEANNLLQAHMIPSTPGNARYRRQLIEFITDPDNHVLGECDVYHNLCMDLFRVGDFDLSLKVCNFALELAPYNRDILGDAIKACGDSSQFAKGDAYLERAMEIPLEKWNFRLFLYSVDFLKTKLAAYPMDDALYRKALDLAENYIRFFPFDEHGYNQQAELMILMNERDRAIATLHKHIFETRPDERDSKSELITAQCCVTLLGLLDDSNDYDFIIQICEKGLRNTTQEQPSSSIGFFMYRKALALDAKAHSDDFRPTTVAAALKFYQVAYDLNQDRQFSRTIEQRVAVLRPYAEQFEPLVKRELYVVENAD